MASRKRSRPATMEGVSKMVELRFVAPDGTAELSAVRLQYRALLPNVDASGAFCPPGVWSEWRDVPTVTESKATRQDAA